MTINTWATRWGIPQAAMMDLIALMGGKPGDKPAWDTEARSQQEIRVEASRRGVRLFRNNNGACETDDGRNIRYGLANDSMQMNRKIKSSDLIGITPIVVEQRHVGQHLGVFTSVEVKRPGWSYKGTDREMAQLAWLTAVGKLGGIARFATCPSDVWPV